MSTGKNRPRPALARDRKAPPHPEPPDGLTVVIDILGTAGDGIAHWQGQRIYVDGALPGETIEITRPRWFRDGWRASVKEWLEESRDRQDPPCPHFQECGGCTAQHMNAGLYRRWKSDRLRHILRAASLAPEQWHPLIGVPAESRRRLTMKLRRMEGALRIGYFRRHSYEFVPVTACPIAASGITDLFPIITQTLPPLLASHGDKGEIEITLSRNGPDILIHCPKDIGLAGHEALAALFQKSEAARLAIQLYHRAPEVILQKMPAIQHFGPVAIDPPSGAFLQPTREGEQALIGFAQTALSGAKRIADLFAGCGTFTFPLAASGASLLAIEGYAPALQALTAAAARAGFSSQVKGEVRDLVRRPLQTSELADYDAVIFDPPRRGAPEQAALLAQSSLQRIVAISCDPRSFARDARLLTAGGFSFRRLMPLDQFLWSPHLELAALFERR